MTKNLTEEQKQQVIDEVSHYLMMDSYDFAISVGDFDLMTGELAAGFMEEVEEEVEEEENQERVAPEPFIDPETGLAPCPFCGEKAYISATPGLGTYVVGCRSTNNLGFCCPGALARQTRGNAYPTKEIAKMSWNTRAKNETGRGA